MPGYLIAFEARPERQQTQAELCGTASRRTAAGAPGLVPDYGTSIGEESRARRREREYGAD